MSELFFLRIGTGTWLLALHACSPSEAPVRDEKSILQTNAEEIVPSLSVWQ